MEYKRIITITLAVLGSLFFSVFSIKSQEAPLEMPVFETENQAEVENDSKASLFEVISGFANPFAVQSEKKTELAEMDSAGNETVLKEGNDPAEIKSAAEGNILSVAISSEKEPVIEEKPTPAVGEKVVEKIEEKKVAPKKTIVSKTSIGVPAPIFSKTRVVDGKHVCKDSNDKPKKSSKNPKGHVDGECCLDPDEIPNSRCYYPPEKYGKLIQRYLNGK